MKNVAIIVPTLSRGGAERVAANMSLEFAKRYNTYVVVHDGSEVIYPYGGRLIDLKLPPAKSRLGKVSTILRRVLALRKFKKQYAIDVSISHLPAANNANVLSRRGDRVLTLVHLMEKPGRKNILRARLTAALSDRVVCVSECVRRNVVENFGLRAEKTATVYNFCDMEPPGKGRGHTGFHIATMGRLTEQKGQWHLIRAMKRVVEELGKDAYLTIVGDGELRGQLESLAQRLGVRENIRFTGFLDDPWQELCEADVYVSSSLWEGLPMALVEAGRCGLPIISTDCDAGCREILAPDTPIEKKTESLEPARFGILVPVCRSGGMEELELTREENIMADAILSLARDEAARRRYADLAARRSQRFRCGEIMKQWEELVE